MSKIIQMMGVTKTYQEENQLLRVLTDINLDIYQGEILGVLGPSGCGKSTLLRQLAGFDQRDAGQILMHGQEITRAQKNRIMIFQDFNQLLPWKTVIENVCYPLRVNRVGKGKTDRRRIAREYLEMVELTGFENHYPHQLSGGMKQKAAIARALALHPEVLLLDEPFGSLDALTRASLQKMLLQVWKETGVTLVFVTHDIEEAVILSDRIVVMGRLSGGIKEILKNPLERPRCLENQGFPEVYRKVYDLLDTYI